MLQCESVLPSQRVSLLNGKFRDSLWTQILAGRTMSNNKLVCLFITWIGKPKKHSQCLSLTAWVSSESPAPFSCVQAARHPVLCPSHARPDSGAVSDLPYRLANAEGHTVCISKVLQTVDRHRVWLLSSGLQATVRGTSPQSHQLIFSAPAAIVMQLSPHAEAGSSLAKGAFCQVKSRRHREMANAAMAIVRWWLLSMCGSTVVVSLSSLKYAQVSYRLGM